MLPNLPDSSAPRVHNLIVFAGGGIRGVLSNQTALYIERYCQAPIYRLFQGVYGTSTGAIQALALTGSAPLSAVQLEREYETLSGRVFRKRFASLGGFAGPLYGAEPLESELRRVLGPRTLKESMTAVGVCTYNMRTREPELWCSYGYGQNQLAWKAARASSAAPTYFPAFGDYEDGGLVANMPCAWAAIDYANFMKVPLSRIRVLAVGTGTAEKSIVGNGNKGKLGRVEDVLDTCMSGSQDLEEIMCRALGLAGYLEVQIGLPEAAQAMDDASAMNVLRLKQLGNQALGQKIREVNTFLDAVRGATAEVAA